MLGSGAIAWVNLAGLVPVTAPVLFLVGLGIARLLNRMVRHVGDPYDDALDERSSHCATRRSTAATPFLPLPGSVVSWS